MENFKKEMVLMYLSGEMTDIEKSKFISELNRDSELADIFEKEKIKFELFDEANVETSEEYFTNLLPRTRMKIDEKVNRKRKMFGFVKFAFPTVMLVAIGLNFIKLDNNTAFENAPIFADTSSYDLLIDSDEYYLDDLIEEDLISSSSFLQLDEEINTNLVYQTSETNFTDIFDRDNYLNELNDFSVSTEEIEKILKTIDSKERL